MNQPVAFVRGIPLRKPRCGFQGGRERDTLHLLRLKEMNLLKYLLFKCILWTPGFEAKCNNVFCQEP